MALDGVFMHFLKREIEEKALGARIEKISQPSREELVFALRWRGGAGKLMLCANASSPRIHFTQSAPENPKAAPMFCMLLRKHLQGAKLVSIRQVGLDRILHLGFETTDELGDLATFTVVLEIMGRHSNLIVLDREDKVLDSVRRVDLETSRVRQVLPGMRYVLPPAQDKLNLLDCEPGEIVRRVRAGREVELSKGLMDAMQGVSPLLCRELAHYTTRGIERLASELDEEMAGRLAFALGELKRALEDNTPTPTMLLEPEGRPREFCCVDLHQYGAAMLTKHYTDCSELLDRFFSDRERIERMRQRSGDLLNLLANTSERIARKLGHQREELKDCAEREALKQKGDLLSANLHLIQKGDRSVRVQDFYAEGSPEVEIELDARLSPSANAQRYYALYRKADTAEKYLTKLIAQGEEELEYIDSVFDALTRAGTEAELDAIRAELHAGGYIRRAAPGGKGQNKSGRKGGREERLPPLRYRSTDGFVILTGRNNVQNDRLTLKEAGKQDLWLHTQKIPGSHTIIVCEGAEVPKRTIEEACIIAAYNSKARESAKVPVDFTRVRNVKKPSGAKPGMVIYDRYETVIVDPDADLVASLREPV